MDTESSVSKFLQNKIEEIVKKNCALCDAKKKEIATQVLEHARNTIPKCGQFQYFLETYEPCVAENAKIPELTILKEAKDYARECVDQQIKLRVSLIQLQENEVCLKDTQKKLDELQKNEIVAR
eukprot:TRINITY_DN1770_c1_g1_i1.p1 TRINITY_DN1770_c1_g1~~TRINITY_DN1770_c1_g1_i1.p1  ORF type:complete len:124 (+),score=20.69 TRINITY_DN1770_c1_g1_i1:117-488(+)